LHPRRERQSRRAAEKRDELAALHVSHGLPPQSETRIAAHVFASIP
jgi:hypothetical protein